MDQGMRTFYLVGYFEALATSDPSSKLYADAQRRCKYGEIARAVTKFYADQPAYARLPVPIAVSFAIRRANGASDDEISKDADFLLTTINKSP